MKHIKIFEAETIAPPKIPNKEYNGIINRPGLKIWIVEVFQSPKGNRRYKSMTREEGDTMVNLLNLIKGGTHVNEIAGIFSDYQEALKLYNDLKYETEE